MLINIMFSKSFQKKCSPKAKNISQVGGDDVAAVHPVISPSATQA
jgi:hypothetical protein